MVVNILPADPPSPNPRDGVSRSKFKSGIKPLCPLVKGNIFLARRKLARQLSTALAFIPDR